LEFIIDMTGHNRALQILDVSQGQSVIVFSGGWSD
jgi:hypothetical protein